MTCEAVLPVASLPDGGWARSGSPLAADLGAADGERRERRGSWWRRLGALRASPQSDEEHRRARLREVFALLSAARAEVLSGWVQGGWWSVPAGRGAPRRTVGLLADEVTPEQVSGVCLVGALARAATHAEPGSGPVVGEVGRAIDAVYSTLWEARGQAAGPREEGLELLSSPPVRLARVRWLTGWNDQPGRTRQDVVDLLDQTISRIARSLENVRDPRPPALSLSGHPGW